MGFDGFETTPDRRFGAFPARAKVRDDRE